MMRIFAQYPDGATIFRVNWSREHGGSLLRTKPNTRLYPFRNEEFKGDETLVYEQPVVTRWHRIVSGVNQNSIESVEVITGRCIVHLRHRETGELIEAKLEGVNPMLMAFPVSKYDWKFEIVQPNTIIKLKRNYRNYILKKVD